MFDVEKIREEFPILHREVYGKPLVYRRKSSAAVYDSLTKEVGAAKEVLFALKQYPDRTVYEAV